MFDIIKSRYIYLWISSIIALFSVFVILFWNLNFWIDMTGGTQSEYTYTWTIDINKIAVWVEELSKNVNLKNPSFNLKNYTNIWKSFWDYIKKTAIVTLTLSIIWISIYVMYAFSWFVTGISSSTFAIITWITLFHDVIVAAWLFIFTSFFFKEFQIDTFFITALLTILGYSINDTIVVFDRIRENDAKLKNKMDFIDIIDLSINQVFWRSLFTSITTLFSILALLILGGASLRTFNFALFVGVFYGAYSSIFLASPILYLLRKYKRKPKDVTGEAIQMGPRGLEEDSAEKVVL